MAAGLPRTSFTRSRLVRVLAELAVTDVPDSKQPFAERVGQWLDVSDTVSLFSALGASAAGTGNGESGAPSAQGVALREELARVRSALVESITTDGVLKPGRARIRLPLPAPDASIDTAADFTPWRQYYLAHQREMAASISQLRASARAAMASQCAPLRQLAALDGALDEALAARERTLLWTVPVLLAKRFAHLLEAHRDALAQAQAPDDGPAQWMGPGGWLAAFCREMQGVLLAELDVRLQPVEGLIEALGNEVTEQR